MKYQLAISAPWSFLASALLPVRSSFRIGNPKMRALIALTSSSLICCADVGAGVVLDSSALFDAAVEYEDEASKWLRALGILLSQAPCVSLAKEAESIIDTILRNAI